MKGWMALLLLGASLAPTAFACICAPHPVERAFAEADAVFIGRPREARVVDSGRNPYLKVVFEVESTWKGLGENAAVVLTPVGDGPCGFWPWDFDPQTRYLIYAENADRVPVHFGIPPAAFGGILRPFWTTLCDRNGVLEGPVLDSPRYRGSFQRPAVAREDLDALGPGTPMRPSGDVTRDGAVDVLDAALTLRAIVGSEALPAEGEIAGDLNGNARIEIGDTVLILRRAVGLAG